MSVSSGSAGRPVGVMHQERPADAARRLLDPRAVRGELLLIFAAQASRPGRRPSARRLRASGTPCGPRRPASPRPGSSTCTRWPCTPPSAISLRRAAMTSGGSRKSPNRMALEKRDSRALRRQARLQRRVAFVRGQRLGDARGGLAARHRRRQPEQRDALAGPHQHLGDGQRQHQRAVALGDGRQVAAGTPWTATCRARARRCATPPIRARARRGCRSWPSGASR